MVSGFLTSPWLHWRMSSAVARPMRSSSKKLTSSTWFLLSCLWVELKWMVCKRGGMPRGRRAGRGHAAYASHLFDRAGLAPGQVDPELLRRAEDVLVGLLHLDGGALAVEDLDIEAEGLHLLDEHLEGLGDAGLGDVVALDDGLVHLHAAGHVVGLDRQQLLQGVGGAVRLERPHLHLTEALATELRLTTERLLGDHRVRAGAAGVDLVVHEVVQLEDVHVADRHRLRERLAG